MTFKVKCFATLRLSVNDVSKSKSWYKALFETEPIEETEKFVSFKINETFLDISEADSKTPVSTGGSVGYWLVDSLDELIKKSVSIGGEIYRGPLKVPETQRTIVQIKDPFGNIIGFEAPF